jgi:hypothetical protein
MPDNRRHANVERAKRIERLKSLKAEIQALTREIAAIPENERTGARVIELRARFARIESELAKLR